MGDPVELAERYERDGADEIVFLDIGATHEERGTMLDLARRTAERLFIPLTIGGGIRTVDDMAAALRAGRGQGGRQLGGRRRPEITDGRRRRFGAQCVVASIDARRDGGSWRVYTAGARVRTELDAVEWARECVARGAGEILLTSIDRDGARTRLRPRADARRRGRGERAGHRERRRRHRGARARRAREAVAPTPRSSPASCTTVVATVIELKRAMRRSRHPREDGRMTRAASPESLLQAVHECAELAGAVALAHYRTGVAVEWKGDGSPVTVGRPRGRGGGARRGSRARFPADGDAG